MPAQSKSNIYFFYEVPLYLPKRTLLKQFISSIFKIEKHKLGNLNYIFCSDQKLLRINRDYLKHDFYTDIITFELSTAGQPIESEIYISVDRIRENAKNLGEPFSKEMLRVIFHGVLHLCGYRDKTKLEKEIMREREDHYLSKYARIRST